MGSFGYAQDDTGDNKFCLVAHSCLWDFSTLLGMTAHQRVRGGCATHALNGLHIKNNIIRRKNNNSYNKNQDIIAKGKSPAGVDLPHGLWITYFFKLGIQIIYNG